ncbi:MAG: type II toxin-antitoxin system RatA family toxin [Hyphomicrobiales bacterium]|nr:type II toxin-antitoxin system RatA family toxin [Hyphomicrobiales bacterium]
MLKIEKKVHSNSSAENLYGLVSDVESYSEFIPWCEKSIIERRIHDYFFAKLNMKYLLFSGSFVSKVTLYDYERRINALGVKGSFRYLEANWVFDEYDDGTLVSVNLELDLNNIILEKAIDSASGVLIKETISSFEKRLLSTS